MINLYAIFRGASDVKHRLSPVQFNFSLYLREKPINRNVFNYSTEITPKTMANKLTKR